MKRLFVVLAVCTAAALMAALCGCNSNANSEASGTTAGTTVATTAPTLATTKPAEKKSGIVSDSNTEQSTTSLSGQQDDADSKKAVQAAIAKAEELYGQGDWRVSSCEEITDSNGQPCWHVGLIDYSKSQSPTYYFYSGSQFCYADNSGDTSATESSDNDEQKNNGSRQKSVNDVIALANQMYGEGDWRIESVIEATTPSGEPCWYIGAVNYSNSQSPTYYFYSSDSFTYADEEVNGRY